MDWSYFNKFEKVDSIYLPDRGEGDTIATQTCTAVCKLVYKWYNDGDVYDNVHSLMHGWCNYIDSCANWLHTYRPESREILERIFDCSTHEAYEAILADLADLLLDEELMEAANKMPKNGSVYECDGPFKFELYEEEDEDDMYWEDEEEYDDYEEEDE